MKESSKGQPHHHQKGAKWQDNQGTPYIKTLKFYFSQTYNKHTHSKKWLRSFSTSSHHLRELVSSHTKTNSNSWLECWNVVIGHPRLHLQPLFHCFASLSVFSSFVTPDLNLSPLPLSCHCSYLLQSTKQATYCD